MLDNNQIRNILHRIDMTFSYDSSKINIFEYQFLSNWFEAIDDNKNFEILKEELLKVYNNFFDSINQLQKYSIDLDYYKDIITKCKDIKLHLNHSNERLDYKYIIPNILPTVFKGCRLDNRYFFANLNNIYELYQKNENHRAGIEQAFYFIQSFYLILLTFYFNNLYNAVRNSKVKSNQKIFFDIEDLNNHIKTKKIHDKHIDLHEEVYISFKNYTQIKLPDFESYLKYYNIFKFENYDESYISIGKNATDVSDSAIYILDQKYLIELDNIRKNFTPKITSKKIRSNKSYNESDYLFLNNNIRLISVNYYGYENQDKFLNDILKTINNYLHENQYIYKTQRIENAIKYESSINDSSEPILWRKDSASLIAFLGFLVEIGIIERRQSKKNNKYVFEKAIESGKQFIRDKSNKTFRGLIQIKSADFRKFADKKKSTDLKKDEDDDIRIKNFKEFKGLYYKLSEIISFKSEINELTKIYSKKHEEIIVPKI